MTDETRDWRAAKPKWVVDAAEAEMRQWKLTAALSWPTEAEPAPVSFMWGDYDHLNGEPDAGVFWSPGAGSYSPEPVHIRSRDESDMGWKRWMFSRDGVNWHDSVTRGPIYRTEREARLARLWRECRDCAKKLMLLREQL